MRSQRFPFVSSVALFVGLPLSSFAPPVGADVIESYWLTEAGDFDDPINWSGPVPDETVTAVFDIDLELGPFVWFRADEVSDRVVIRRGHVYFMMWDQDEMGEMVSRAVDVLNSNITTPSIVVAETPGVDAALSIAEGYVTTQSMVIAHGVGSSATVNFGTGLFDLSAGLACELQLHVGGGGEGLLVIEEDIEVTTDVLVLGIEPGSSGEIVVTDPDTSLDATGACTVGLGGSGVLSVSNQANLTSGLAVIGQQPGSSGAATLTGLGTTWSINGPLDVGFQGQGALTVTDGVVLTDGFAVIGAFPEPGPEPTTGGTGAVTISGPTAFWGINGDLHVALLWEGSLNVLDGAAVASHNGFVGLNQNPVGQATLQGPGSAWSNIGELVIAGTLHVSDGAIVIANTMDLLADTVLEGDGTIRATANSGGILQPGNPTGTLTIEGELSLEETNQLFIELAGADAGSFDAIAVTDAAIASGGLTVTLSGGFMPEAGDRFAVLTADDLTGSFEPVTLPALDLLLKWVVVQDSTSVKLLATSIADIDGDGSVGARDFLELLAAWGPCPDPPEPCPADLDGDGSVSQGDFLILLAQWG